MGVLQNRSGVSRHCSDEILMQEKCDLESTHMRDKAYTLAKGDSHVCMESIRWGTFCLVHRKCFSGIFAVWGGVLTGLSAK